MTGNWNALEKRPELRQALELSRKSGATLLITKLDRPARNVHFVSGLMESKVKSAIERAGLQLQNQGGCEAR